MKKTAREKMSGFNPPRKLDNRMVGNANRLVPIAGLVFVVSVVGLGLLLWRGQPQAEAVPAQASTYGNPLGSVALYTLPMSVAAGEKIPLERVQEIFWPNNQVPEGAVRDRAELAEKYAKVSIAPNQPLQRLALSEQPIVQALPVTPGNRAVSIEVDAISGIEGHARAGTYVDVVLTHRVNGVLTSKVIVQNTRVLSLQGDTKTFDKLTAEKGAVNKEATVTLDVSPRDALAITTARQLGRLSLIMRSSGDQMILAEDELNQNEIGPEDSVGVRPIVPRSSPQCIKGTYQLKGKNYQLNCDGTTVLLDDLGE